MHEIRQKTGRLANGHEADAGKIWHAVPGENNAWGREKALCSTRPGFRGLGWSDDCGETVTCKRCLDRLAKLAKPEEIQTKTNGFPLEIQWFDILRTLEKRSKCKKPKESKRAVDMFPETFDVFKEVSPKVTSFTLQIGGEILHRFKGQNPFEANTMRLANDLHVSYDGLRHALLAMITHGLLRAEHGGRGEAHKYTIQLPDGTVI